MRCDLHVHSATRGRSTCPAFARRGRRVVRRAAGGLRRGAPARHGPRHPDRPRHHRGRARAARACPGTFVSEEVTCALPGRARAAPGRLRHRRGAARGDRAPPRATRRRSSRTSPSSACPPASTTRSRRSPGGARRRTSSTRSRQPAAVEARNGMMSAAVNRARGAGRAPRPACAMVGGSDAHTLASVGARLHRRAGRRATRGSSWPACAAGCTLPAGRSGTLRAPDRGRRAHRRGRVPHRGRARGGRRAAAPRGRARGLRRPCCLPAPGDGVRLRARAALRAPPRAAPARGRPSAPPACRARGRSGRRPRPRLAR